MIRSLFLSLCCISILAGQVRVVEDSLTSRSLGRSVRYAVLLPEGYSSSNEQYAVLYLLHGFNQDHTAWYQSTDLVHELRPLPLIIVSFDAGNSWYVNSATVPQDRFDDLFIRDVIPFIDSRYRTKADRSHRFIGGMSMGAYGTLRYALKFPSLFSVAAAMSPSIQFPAGLEDSAIVARRSAGSNASVRAAFGAVRSAAWDSSDIMLLARSADAATAPYIILADGAQDGIPEVVTQTHDLAAILRARTVPFEMHETPGAHDWKFWQQELRRVLTFLSSRIAR